MVEKYLELIDSKTAAFTSDVARLSDLVPRQGGGISSIGVGRPFASSASSGTRDAYVNFDTTGGATLVVEASLGNGSDFHEVEKITDAGVSQITGYPRMRLSLTNVASGTHSAGIYGEIVREGRFIDVLTDLQLTGNLRLCLDAGDSNSYSGSGQDWVDVSGTGNADEFHLGTADTAGSGDPTFNGTAGLTHRLFDTGNMATSNVGIGLTNSTGDVLQLFGGTGSGTLIDQRSSIKHGVNSWNFISVAVDEAAGASGSEFYVNESNELFDAAYNSPVASAATNSMHLGSSGIEAGKMPSGARMAGVMFWDKKLTTGEINSIYNTTKGRFGL